MPLDDAGRRGVRCEAGDDQFEKAKIASSRQRSSEEFGPIALAALHLNDLVIKVARAFRRYALGVGQAMPDLGEADVAALPLQ